VRYLIETPVELLSPQEQTARAQVFVALRPLVNLVTALTEPNGVPAPTADPHEQARERAGYGGPTRGAGPTDNRGMGE
jgi:hypothetical protein